MDDRVEYENLLLAAMMHDIGKFWQGAGKRGEHPSLSSEFVKKYFIKYQNVHSFVLNHHNPKNNIEKIIQNADHLSAEEREELEEERKGKRKDEPLISIFSEIELNNQKLESQYYPLKFLNLEKNSIFPKKKEVLLAKEKIWHLQPSYEQLWKQFVSEIEKISENNFNSLFETLYFVMKKYTLCVPSAVYLHVPDISLFDHSKTTCAIASCLYEYNTREKEKFLLVGGDVSGIQKFIYTITSKGAAKSLRGRSLYLQLLSEIIAKHIIKELNLTITNLLYCSGGHFYILAPKNIEDKLLGLRRRINEKLLDFHKGELYIALTWIPLSEEDFKKEKFAKKWSEIAGYLSECKKKKFSEIFEEERYEILFGPMDEGGKKEICDACKNESSELLYRDESNGWQPWSVGIDEEKFCSMCKSFIDLSEEARIAEHEVEIYNPKQKIAPAGTYQELLNSFGFNIHFKENLDAMEYYDGEGITVYKLNSTDFLNEKSMTLVKDNVSYGFKFLPRTVPELEEDRVENGKTIHKGSIKDLDSLGEEAEGIKQVAILRMDVDNLGKIFAKGLGDNATISRVSTLSTMLSLFFEGYLNKYIEQKHRNKIYVVYSGGDDSFIIGSWNVVLDLVYDLYNEFREFTCRNPDITLSAGIAVLDPKFPVYKGAEIAGSALEEKAKYGDKNKVFV